MIISDGTIRKAILGNKLVVKPFDEALLQPSSVDVRLDYRFRVFKHVNSSLIDVDNRIELTDLVEVEKGKHFVLHPGDFVLGSTLEWVEIPTDWVARLEGKSSLGRIGIITHSTAGYIDPGFKGNITLELTNIGKVPVALHPGMKIAQLSFSKMDAPAERPYGHKDLKSKYLGQEGPKEAELHNLKLA